MKKAIFILLFISLFFGSFAQRKQSSNAGLGIVYLNGELNVRSHFRVREWTVLSKSETNKNLYFTGEAILNSRTYIWRPSFLLLDIGGSYSPGKLIDDYLVSPDFSEVNISKRLDLGLTLFNGKKITLNSFVSFIEKFQNRESLTNIKTKNFIYGGSIIFTNKYFPLSVTYQDDAWDQTELLTNRKYITHNKTLNGRIIKSFSILDKNELRYTYDDDKHEYLSGLIGNTNSKIHNKTHRINLNNKVYFSSKKNSNINSIIIYRNQKGDIELNRFSLNEIATIYLPKNFTSINTYHFSNLTQKRQTTTQHRLRTDLRHKLFLSLRTDVFFEYINLKHTLYEAYNYRGGISVAYQKKIPTRGVLGITYYYSRYHDDFKSQSRFLNFYNEEHTLSDAEIELLNKPYITDETVLVKDVSGTIIYQLNFDYTLIQRNNFIEIRRIPGGQIADGGVVYVDYQVVQSGNYAFDANNHTFSTSVLLFNQKIEIYYEWSKQDYVNTEMAEFLTLNYFKENIVGARINLKFGSAGIEYDDYNSSIVPFKVVRYFVHLQHNFKNKLLLSFNGDVRDYKMINKRTDQTYIDLTAKISYSFKPQIKLTLDLGYRNQIGETIDLNLLTSRIEFSTVVRQLQLDLGVEVYKRTYINEEVLFNGVYIRITRRFNYR